MKQQVLSRYDIFTVGETPLVTTEHAVAITQEDSGPLNMLFQFEHVDLDRDRREGATKWDLRPLDINELKQVMTRWQKDLEQGGGWNSFYLSNHDQPRMVSRFGNDGHYRVQSAKLLATFLHMMHGTPYIYQGEEIGMTNVAFESITQYRDIETLNMYHAFVEERGLDPHQVLRLIHARSRDNARTPMQWDDSPHAGFTSSTPWIDLNPNYPAINVVAARADPDSIWHYYQTLIRLRREHPIIVYGSYDLICAEHPQIYAFTRTYEHERLLIILNFTAETATFTPPDQLPFSDTRLLISNYPVRPTDDVHRLSLRPFEARVYWLY